MSFRVHGNRVLIEVDEETDTTPSGLVLPGESGKETLRYGTVKSVSDGYYNDKGTLTPIPFKPDDRVFWARGQGSVIKVEDVEYLCLAEHQIAGWLD